MTAVDWLWQTVLAVGWGIGSAVFPPINAETYVLGAGVTRMLDPVAAAAGVAVGQTIGKVGLFLIVRYRPWHRTANPRPEPRALDLSTRWGRFRQRVRDFSKRMLDLISEARFGIPVTLLSSFVGIPPLYAVALIAGASRMRLLGFTLAVLVGRLARFITIAVGGASLF